MIGPEILTETLGLMVYVLNYDDQGNRDPLY